MNRLSQFHQAPQESGTNEPAAAGAGRPSAGAQWGFDCGARPFSLERAVFSPGVQAPAPVIGSASEPGNGSTAPLARPNDRAARPQSREAATTITDLETAHAADSLLAEFHRLTAGGMSLRMAAHALGKSPSWFSGARGAVARRDAGGVAALRPRTRHPASAGVLTVQIEALGWFVPAARHFWLLSNSTWNRGSTPEAIRRVISLPHLPAGWKASDRERFLKCLGLPDVPECPVELREAILLRQREGKPLVPERIARQIAQSAARVRAYRNPTDFSLDYLNSPGGMRLTRDVVTGQMRLARALEIVEGDDATVNFPVCIPWSFGGTPSADKFGVLVGRFQWLVFVDVGTGKVLGYSYTARPRSSYRGEDVLAAMRGVVRQHGVPQTWRFEQGVWKSNLVRDAVRGMGARLDTVYSPHQKPFIEGLFNTLWTKLSVHFPSAHVGRYQGEHEQANDLLTRCQRGHTDPRRHFPMLAQVIAAFDEAISEKDNTPINSEAHGRWIPSERFAEQMAAQPARRLDPETDWIFSPFVREWTVRGMLVGGKVPLFEGLSVPFDFSAPWLPDYDGALVRAYFDPSEPRCAATITLAEARNGRPVGTVLGSAGQVNDIAAYARLAMGWGDDPERAGALARQVAAAAVRREVRATVGNGRGASTSEERDGCGVIVRVEQEGATGQAAGTNTQSANTQSTNTQEPKDQAPSTNDQGRGGLARGAARAVTPEPGAERLAAVEDFEREHALEFV